MHTEVKKPWMKQLVITGGAFLLLACIFKLMGKTPTSEKNNPTGNGPGERRATSQCVDSTPFVFKKNADGSLSGEVEIINVEVKK